MSLKENMCDMTNCRVCGEPLRMNTGDLQYGAKVHVCPRCRTPYVDPKIIELAAVPERDRAGHRMRYARQLDKRLALFAAAMMTLAASMFLSGALVQGFWPLLLIFAGTYAGIVGLSFGVKFFLVFPKLARESAKRMADTWYLTRLKACVRAA